MRRLRSLLRGWLAISFVQQIGLAIQHLRNPSILYRTLFDIDSEGGDTLGGQLFVLICLQQSLLKGAILLTDTDRFLHIFHISNSILFLAFFGIKTLMGDFALSMGVAIQIFFASITIILTTLHLLQESPNSVGNEKGDRIRGPRKLISKHFLESHISDYDPQIRKNQ